MNSWLFSTPCLNTLPKHPVQIPEDNQWHRIEGPGYTCSYPPPYLRGGKGPDLALFFEGRKLSKIERDIIEDKKIHYKITERETPSKRWVGRRRSCQLLDRKWVNVRKQTKFK